MPSWRNYLAAKLALSLPGVDMIQWGAADYTISTGRPGQASPVQEFLDSTGQAGKAFIAIALGVIFAGVYAAAISAFVGRVSFLWDFIWKIIERYFPIA